MTSVTNAGRTLSYQYDAADDRTRMTWPDTGANALYVAYVHDVLNRVTMVEENGATSGPGLLARYGYDSLGRRSTIARAGGTGAATGYAYDGASRLYTLGQTLAGSASVTYTFGYNASGQIVTRAATNDSYTAQPAAVTAGYTAANSATLSYDPTGALQSETTAGATTTFLYDGTALIGEYSSNGTILNRYVMGPGQDEPLTWYQGAGTTTRNWLTADNQGSVIGYADQNGNSLASYLYGPYGEPITAAGAPAWGGSRYRYTGQIEIPEAQLYYYKARVYDPGQGRFQQTDPAGLTSDVNLYGYAYNDPINGSDPSGLWDGDEPDPDFDPDPGSGGGDVYVDVQEVVVKGTPCPITALCLTPQQFFIQFGGQLADALGTTVGASTAVGVSEFVVKAKGKPTNSRGGQGFDVPKNPCSEAGNAPDPHAYADAGLFLGVLGLPLFVRGGPFDAQPKGGSRAYGNYVYGAYLGASSLPLSFALAGANYYAEFSGANYPPGTASVTYPNIPAVNVQNIKNMYNASVNNSLCSKQ